MAGLNTQSFNATNFEELVLRSEQPVLVDFWASWCGPCRAIAPIIDALADKYVGRARIGKIDVDESRELALRFNVQSIPTLMVFVRGRLVEQVVGTASLKQLAGLIDPHLETSGQQRVG